MPTLLPAELELWQSVESIVKNILSAYAFKEIRTPLLERTELFQRTIGEQTDVVSKEMYSFMDRKDQSLSLRPEATAGVVRAGIEHGLFYNQTQKLWSMGPMYRYERPQKGRYRQFHQFGVEAFGMTGPDIDVEVLQVAAALWNELDLTEHLSLEINNIGSAEDRKNFGKALTKFLESKVEQLDDDARNRMYSNPLRVLDSKNSMVQAALSDVPVLEDYVNEESRQYYKQLKASQTDLKNKDQYTQWETLTQEYRKQKTRKRKKL